MRTPDRDRRRPGVPHLCIAVTLAFLVAAGTLSSAFPTAEYTILPNGTAYEAAVSIGNATTYEFYETGALGERIPMRVGSVWLTGDCDPCTFNRSGPYDSLLTFPKGNYTVHFQGAIRDYHMLATFDQPYRVIVAVPGNFALKNPLLGMVSPGGTVRPADGTNLTAEWNGTRNFELRFYDQGREELLYLFGNFWVVIAVVLLMPFAFSWMRKRPKP